MNKEILDLLTKLRANRQEKLRARQVVYEKTDQTLEESVQEYQNARSQIEESKSVDK